MFEKWFEQNRKLRFLSQLAAFLITISAFMSFGNILKAINYNPSAVNYLWNQLVVSISFHIVIGLLFLIRFILLFFNSKRKFVISQVIWIICILAIFGFHIATRFAIYGGLFPPESDISFGMDHYPIIFLYADYSFALLTFIYFFISPIRQAVTLIFTYFKAK